jgi:hypothetical protein
MAVHKRRVFADHHVRVAFVLDELVLEDEEVFGNRGDVRLASVHSGDVGL